MGKVGKEHFGVLVTAVLLCILLVFPVPLLVIDLLLLGQLVFAILVVVAVVTRYFPNFYAFPVVMVSATVVRIVVEVASTRGILTTGRGGIVVNTAASLTSGGLLPAGAMGYLALFAVQYWVIAKGGERVAEVTARFALDALPGRQHSIDGELRSGVITHEQARTQRAEIWLDSRYYGSMDGALRLVKSDVVVGLGLALLNVVAGSAIGLLYHGVSLSLAVSHYVHLAIGQAIATQIPGLLITVSAVLLVTQQQSSTSDRSKKHLSVTPVAIEIRLSNTSKERANSMVRSLPITIKERLGWIAPSIGLAFADHNSKDGANLTWEIAVNRVAVTTGVASPNTNSTEALVQSVLQTARHHTDRWVTVDHIQRLMDQATERYPGLVRQVKALGINDILLVEIAVNLLRDLPVPIDEYHLLNTLCTYGGSTQDADVLVERLRQSLALEITKEFAVEGTLKAWFLGPEMAEAVRMAQARTTKGRRLQIEKSVLDEIRSSARKMISTTERVLIVDEDIRANIAKLLLTEIPHAQVLSFSEVMGNTKIVSVGCVGL